MQELHSAVRQVLLFHPSTVMNYGIAALTVSSSPNEKKTVMAEAAEFLVSQLIFVLSRGLHEGVDLWSVLETLERVPNKIAQEDASSSAKQALHRLKFSGQLIYVVKSTFVRSTAELRTRALLRLALNQGVLLAALELIARWNAAELVVFYTDPASSVLCCVDDDLWDMFLRACAPIGGVTLADIEAGVPKGASVVKFDMKLALPGVDADDVASSTPCNDDAGERGSSNGGATPVQMAGPVDHGDPLHVQLLPLGGRAPRKPRRRRRHRRGVRSRKTAHEEVNKEVERKALATPPPLVEEDVTSEDVASLLDHVEALLLGQWGYLNTAMSVREALLFEEAEHG
ncbi:hypothetical protein DQ04_00201070 [Trypanosoma grayi]|uniref:hypothetical protein n=1 Tax=Trypanosoma grayi TaxID=71804 RepID=UPI0004F41087|nr:hypothetical protein DQ04_00201070 [Trypanosoma grayi]KEG15054.1 hypothetical protein DQ04_00201070 [Trypanosoma grayi]